MKLCDKCGRPIPEHTGVSTVGRFDRSVTLCGECVVNRVRTGVAYAKEIQAATEWWVNAITGTPKMDNGDSQHAAMFLLASAINAPAKGSIERFADELRRVLEYEIDDWTAYAKRQYPQDWENHITVLLKTDYHPEEALYEAAKLAGVNTAMGAFPCKTIMVIRPGKVEVACGYHAETETIYEEAA